MRSGLACAIVLCLISFCYGQNAKPLEYRLALGLSPESDIVETVDSAFVFSKQTNKLVFSGEVAHQILDRFEFAAQISIHQIPFEILNNDLQVEYGNYYRTYLGFKGRYEYIQAKKYTLYSGLGLGYSYIFKRGRIPNKSAQGYEENNDFLIRPNVSLLLIGASHKLNERLGVYSELNLGSPYTFCLGLSYGFQP